MLIVKVKICGLTNLEDARAAVDMGAELLGFNFYPGSPRYVTRKKVLEITNRLPAFVDVAGVFVNSSLDEIKDTIEECGLNWVQLHGDEDTQFCRSLLSINVKTMKAIRVKNGTDIKKASDFYTDAILLDAFDCDAYGGTGKSFDWNIIGHIGKRIFLAGGINPNNVEKAVKIGVYGIDVCSGVESSPGKKDHKKMQALFDNISHLRA